MGFNSGFKGLRSDSVHCCHSRSRAVCFVFSDLVFVRYKYLFKYECFERTKPVNYYSQLHICKTHTRRKSDRLNAADCLACVTYNGSLVTRTVVELNGAKLNQRTFSLLSFALSTVSKEHCFIFFKVPRRCPFILLERVKVTILTGPNRSIRRKPRLSPTLSTKTITWTAG